MTSRNGSSLLILAVLLFPGIGQAGLFGPSNYDECITKSMTGVSSDVAARAIMASCRNQFPQQEEAAAPQANPPVPQYEAPAPHQAAVATGPSRSLTTEELGNLGTKARVFGSSYTITFQNRNEHLTITEITIAVWDESDPSGLREYRQEVNVAPLGSSVAKYTVYYKGADQTWTWKVASAKGID